jgi:hypothetical protein
MGIHLHLCKLALDRPVRVLDPPGAIAFLIYAKAEHTWPFGPKEVKEAFVDAPKGT